MDSHTGTFKSGDYDIQFKRWQPGEAPRAVILLVHGLAEHYRRYEALADHMVNHGVAVCAIDLPGHGESSGEKGHIVRLQSMIDSVADFRSMVAEWFPDKPVFLLGHSMGGLISSRVLQQQQERYAGCVLSGPAVRSPLQPPFYQLLIIRLLSRIAPRARVLGLDPTGVSRDPDVVQRYIDDPLVYSGKITARFVAELFAHMQRVHAQSAAITTPVLLLHGSADSIAAPEGAKELHDNVSSTDKTLKFYEGLFHEIFNEPEGPQVFKDISDWILARA